MARKLGRYWKDALLSKSFVYPKIIYFKLINKYHNNLLASYFEI